MKIVLVAADFLLKHVVNLSLKGVLILKHLSN